MQLPNRFQRAFLVASILSLAVTSGGYAQATPNEDLATQVQDLKARLAQLEAKQNENWMTDERTKQIKTIVEGVLADAKSRGQFQSGTDFGYSNGFYIQSADKTFKLVINGYAQFRYTFSDSTVKNASTYATQPKAGDASGFDFRYLRLTFSGNAFTPNLTYLITGDFAGNSTNVNNFQVVDAYFAYRFNDLLNIRAGAFLAPFSHLEYISSGLALVDFPALFNPFDPARVFGVSLFGDIVKDQLLYEINVNNGPQSNKNGRAAELAGLTDNRPSLYARLQYFGGTGKPSDFADESDLRKDTSTAAWNINGAFGYESANTSNTAFPGKQGSTTIPGIAALTTPGFLTYPLNGDLFRGTIDGELKYQGWHFLAAAFIQQINENPGAGITTATSGTVPATLPPGYGSRMSFFQASYYGQVGYMINKQWEAVARAGQLFTEGGPQKMEEYALGLNYFGFGKNVKIQADVTYFPNAAGLSNTTFGTFVNTQDIVGRLQLQVKF